MRDFEAFCANLPSPKRNSSDMKLWKRVLKIVIKMRKCVSRQSTASDGDGGGGRGGKEGKREAGEGT